MAAFRLVAFCLALLPCVACAQAGAGMLKGGTVYALPSWFKSSFLDFREDVEEARSQGRHVLAFFYLDECPYCHRMLTESFESGASRDFMQRHFDVVAVNLRGTAETTWIDGKTYTERSLARHLKATGTPTLVFVDPDGKKVLQLTGYRDPAALRLALEYVQSRSYRDQTLAAYLESRARPAVYTLRPHPQFVVADDFKDYDKPLAILFEDRHCAECDRFHDKTLNHPDVLAEMKAFRFVRLDAQSTQRIVAPDGKATTPAQWARDLDLSYRPAVVLFNRGREVFRIDGRFYHFHFKEALRYVSGGHDAAYAAFNAYTAARRRELLQRGIDIDYAE